MVVLVNRAKMTTATVGTGTITLGSADTGYQSFADAGVVDADVVRYVIEDGVSWEIGDGTYTASGTTLSRSVIESSNADSAISLTGSAVVFVSAIAADFAGAAFLSKTTTYTAVAGESILADTNGGTWTLTLPASPATGDTVTVADPDDWSANNLTIGRNGSTIEGDAADMTMDIGGALVRFVYDGTTWEIFVQVGVNSGTVVTEAGSQTLTNKTISGASNTLTVDGTNGVGFLDLPAVGTKTGSYTLATGDVGKYVQVGTGGSITIPDATFSEGDAISIFNNTTGDITITCTITTAYIAGTDANDAAMTLATRGVATILFISGTVCVVTGNVS